MCRFVQNRVEQAAWPRESDSLVGCLSSIRPATTNGGRAAEPVIQKLVVGTQQAWMTFAEHGKTDVFIDTLRIGLGHKSLPD